MKTEPKKNDAAITLETIRAATTKELLSGLPTIIRCELYEEAAMVKAELDRRHVPFPPVP